MSGTYIGKILWPLDATEQTYMKKYEKRNTIACGARKAKNVIRAPSVQIYYQNRFAIAFGSAARFGLSISYKNSFAFAVFLLRNE